MGKRKQHPMGDPRPGTTHNYRWQGPTGMWIETGQEIHVHGEIGRFRFVRHVATADREWIEVWDKDRRYRFFHPERLKRAHRKAVTRESAIADAKGTVKSARSEAARKAWETRRARESAA
jgi:hypothetical protein